MEVLLAEARDIAKQCTVHIMPLLLRMRNPL